MPRGKDTKSLFPVYNLLTTDKKFIPCLQFAYNRLAECVLFAPLLLQRLESAALPSGHEPL